MESAGNILKRFENDGKFDVNSFWKALTKGNLDYSCPNDEQFKAALENPALKLLLKDSCKYLLYKLEKNSVNAQNLPRYENSYLHYILPKKIVSGSNWEKYIESKNYSKNYADYTEALGNLMLTTSSRQDNSSFFETRADCANSDFYYTKSLKYFLDWTPKQIINRSKTLSERALPVWEVPEEYAKSVSIQNNNYNLYIDFEKCTNKKPASLSIPGKEIPNIKNWRDVFFEILNFLYEENEKFFVQAAAEYISINPEDFKTPVKIGNRFYIETNRETKKLLRRAQIIVENFDSISGGNFKDSISFTLKN